MSFRQALRTVLLDQGQECSRSVDQDKTLLFSSPCVDGTHSFQNLSKGGTGFAHMTHWLPQLNDLLTWTLGSPSGFTEEVHTANKKGWRSSQAIRREARLRLRYGPFWGVYSHPAFSLYGYHSLEEKKDKSCFSFRGFDYLEDSR